MLICVPKSDFRKVSDGEVIALFEDDTFIGYASVLTVLESIIILEVGQKIAKLYEDLIKQNKIATFHIY
ncbi:hypothetical protein [Acetivibrio cellulolyticus]|uniref:hypothetical protein n=1 Tax=Acetivibrio cellulolyticus TaxID=35830 RepID=UPI0001E2E35D|nr:hypothetical protein [Acetivibrio cellulolyticus]